LRVISSGNASADLLERGPAIWAEIITRCGNGPLPFIRFDPENPSVVTSFWEVADGSNEVDDLVRGACYAQLLTDRAKATRENIDPFRVIEAVLLVIVVKGDVGAVARGFVARLSMLAAAGSLN
jgi:hypothetical protein